MFVSKWLSKFVGKPPSKYLTDDEGLNVRPRYLESVTLFVPYDSMNKSRFSSLLPWLSEDVDRDSEVYKIGPFDIYEVPAFRLYGDRKFHYKDLFGLISKDLHSLTMRDYEIKEFLRSHRHLLDPYSQGTFFLFEDEDSDGLIAVDADADMYGDGIEVRAHLFEDDDVWYADRELRVVVPATDCLTLGPQGALTP
jgi:hypothetical protein